MYKDICVILNVNIKLMMDMVIMFGLKIP